MPYCGNSVSTRDRNACLKDYEVMKQSAMYFVAEARSAWTAPTAKAYVEKLIEESGDSVSRHKGKLAVVSGVVAGDSVAFHVAQELALQVGMHVVLLAKSESNLLQSIRAIRKEATSRGLKDEEKKDVVLYYTKLRVSSLESARQAAEFVTNLARRKYDGQIHVLVNHACVGSDVARLTNDGIEYNTGCNFVCGHYLIKLLLPHLQNVVSSPDTIGKNKYKPRVVQVASIGHALGDRFNPNRLVDHPKEGGAPEGYIVVQPDGDIREFEKSDQSSDLTSSGSPFANDSNNTSSNKMVPVAMAGTQVGRSKMAVVYDIIHWSKLHPDINFTSHHPGSITSLKNHAWTGVGSTAFNWLYQYGLYPFRWSPSQGARAALRAALDPDFDTCNELQGAYLHVDGDPWHPAVPRHTKDENVSLYARACYEAAEALLEKLAPVAAGVKSPHPPKQARVVVCEAIPMDSKKAALASERNQKKQEDRAGQDEIEQFEQQLDVSKNGETGDEEKTSPAHKEGISGDASLTISKSNLSNTVESENRTPDSTKNDVLESSGGGSDESIETAGAKEEVSPEEKEAKV